MRSNLPEMVGANNNHTDDNFIQVLYIKLMYIIKLTVIATFIFYKIINLIMYINSTIKLE